MRPAVAHLELLALGPLLPIQRRKLQRPLQVQLRAKFAVLAGIVGSAALVAQPLLVSVGSPLPPPRTLPTPRPDSTAEVIGALEDVSRQVFVRGPCQKQQPRFQPSAPIVCAVRERLRGGSCAASLVGTREWQRSYPAEGRGFAAFGCTLELDPRLG